jgi:hypothetical protein
MIQDHVDKYASWYEEGKFTIGERRVLLTQWVAVAWKRLHEEYKDTIIKTFRSVGLSLNPDGSEDHELKIKGLADIKVGDYTQREPEIEDGLGSLLPVDVEEIAAAKVKLAALLKPSLGVHFLNVKEKEIILIIFLLQRQARLI